MKNIIILPLLLLLSGCFYHDIRPPVTAVGQIIGCQSHNGALFCLTRYEGQGRFVPETDPPAIASYACTINDITQVYDGDTITDVFIQIAETPFPAFDPTGEVFPNIVLTDAGVHVQNGLRIAGIDTPEIRPSTKKRDGTPRSDTSRANEKKAAIAARDTVRRLIIANRLRFRIENVSMDKFGRVLANVFVGDLSIGEYLIANRYALPYDGGTRQELDWETLGDGFIR